MRSGFEKIKNRIREGKRESGGNPERSGHCKQGVLVAEMPLCGMHEKARLP